MTRSRSRGAIIVATITALAMLIVGAPPSIATHGPASPTTHPQVLGRGSFTDAVEAQFRVKLDGRRTRVINVSDPSDVVTVKITVDPGAVIGWHTHPGPVIVTVASGELTYVNADDCVRRTYAAGTAFIDPGQGNAHAAYNSFVDPVTEAPGETVLVATFLGVVGPLSPGADAPAGCVVP